MTKKQTAVIKEFNYSICIDGTLTNLLNGKIKKWTKDTNGYMRTQIWTNGKCINITQHRILAQYFIDNLENKTQVNHINGIKHDNRIENLEWVTQSENSLHFFANELQKVTRPCKKVLNTITGEIYESVTEASEKINISRGYLSNMLANRQENKTTLKFYGK
jgi:hypothetical protein